MTIEEFTHVTFDDITPFVVEVEFFVYLSILKITLEDQDKYQDQYEYQDKYKSQD